MVKEFVPPVLTRAAKRLVRGPLGDRLRTSITIRGVDLTLPVSHALPSYRRKWTAYDTALPLLGDAIRIVDPDACIVDIGANIGDTAAALSRDAQGTPRTDVLCIEGDPEFLRHLRINAARMGPTVEVEESFVGAQAGHLNAGQLERHGGTGTTVRALRETSLLRAATSRTGRGVGVRRLEEILSDHQRFSRPSLIKSDTDGYDFSILIEHLDLIADLRPVLYFEYQIHDASEQLLAEQTMTGLAKIGYASFLVFDNFGNRLLRLEDASQMADLSRYLVSNQVHGVAVQYLDVCAVTHDDTIVLDRFDKLLHDLTRWPHH